MRPKRFRFGEEHIPSCVLSTYSCSFNEAEAFPLRRALAYKSLAPNTIRACFRAVWFSASPRPRRRGEKHNHDVKQPSHFNILPLFRAGRAALLSERCSKVCGKSECYAHAGLLCCPEPLLSSERYPGVDFRYC